MPRRRSLRAFLRDERGGIAIMAACFAVCGVAALAIGVDVVSVFVEKRRAQGAVDLAAIAAARDPDKALAAATATINDNGVFGVENIVITKGRYVSDTAVPIAERFVPNETPINAVQVALNSRAQLFFGKSIFPQSSMEVVTTATAVSTASAAFTIGSRLLSLNSGVLNALLGGLLGGNLSLSVMDYNALAGYKVDLFKFSNALGTSVIGQAGTYEQLAASRVSVGQIIDAMIHVARDNGGGPLVDFALKQIKNSTNAGDIKLDVAKLFDFGQSGPLQFGQGAAALNAKASVLSVLQAAAEVANGAKQADIATAISVPGLLSTTLGITVGERPQASPWLRFGKEGAEVYTAQTRIRLIAEVGGSGLLAGIRLRVPVYVDIAAARARLASLSCGMNPASDTRVTLAVRPSVVNAWIAEPVSAGAWKTLGSPPDMTDAQIISAPLISATGKANAKITNLSDSNVTFNYSEIANLTPKTVRTAHFTQSLVASLLGNLSLNVSVGPLSLLSPAVLRPLIQTILAPAAPLIDGVLNNALKTLGIGLGEADVWVNGVRCDGAALVR